MYTNSPIKKYKVSYKVKLVQSVRIAKQYYSLNCIYTDLTIFNSIPVNYIKSPDLIR